MQPTFTRLLDSEAGTLWQVDDAFSGVECAALIQWAEGLGYVATGPHYPPQYRNNDRLVVDNPAWAARLWTQLQGNFPSSLTDAEGNLWKKSGLNPRFRSCRYEGGQSFCRHQDGAFSSGEDTRSWFTFMVYLNDGSGFSGGATRYFDGPQGALLHSVQPRTGRVVIFDHRLWHDGEPVTHGVKYVLRSDVMYTRETAQVKPGGHSGYVFCVRFSDGGALCSGGRDKTVRTWDGNHVTQIMNGHTSSVFTLLPTENGIWRGCRDGCWRNNHVCVQAHDGAVLASVACDKSMLTAGADGTVARWSPDGKLLARYPVHTGWVWGLSTTESGFLTAGEDGSVAQWDSRGGLLWRWKGPSPVRALENGACGDANGMLRVLERGTVTSEIQLHVGPITAVKHVGLNSVYTGGEDGHVRRVDLTTGTVSEVGTHDGMVRSLDFSAGVLASGSYDSTVRRWVLP